MKLRKTQVAAAVGGALLLVGTAVQAQTAPTVQVYGQVSRALMFADDGSQSKWFHTDAEPSGTRFGITGSGQAMPALRYGFRIEVDLQSNESQRVSFSPQANSSGNQSPQSSFAAVDEDHGGFADRYMEVYLEGSWGRFLIGQGDGAANGATESDLSGTGMANGIGVADYAGGINFRTTSVGGVAATAPFAFGPNLNSTLNQQDFESRYDRLLYVTPTFGGFRGQVSWGQKAASGITVTNTVGQSVTANTDVKEASLWYGGKFGGFGELAASLGWSERQANVPGGTKDEYVGGSVSWLHGTGINLTFSYSKRDQPQTGAANAAGVSLESTFTYFKVGWRRGAHAIAVDYAMGDDFAAQGDEAKMYGIGYVWNPVRWLELFAAYKVQQLDRPGSTNGSGAGAVITPSATYDDVKIGVLGTRVRF